MFRDSVVSVLLVCCSAVLYFTVLYHDLLCFVTLYVRFVVLYYILL